MRLRRLDLTRYGKFTDHSIDFGEAIDGRPDLHIIYGLNEAGKSTAFNGFLDLLFGIGATSDYNFLHPYSAMQIGARLEFDGAAHELVRLKRRTGSLLDDAGQAVNEAVLSAALGGVGRDAYRTMFSLDDQSLKDGGQAIIQSKGELGELLFSASSGLAGLNASLIGAADDAAAIYRKRSSSTRLAELKRALDTLKNERTAIDTFAAAYSVLTATLAQVSASYEAAGRDLAEAKIRHGELARILAALPLASELGRLTAEIANLGALPRPPADWFLLLPQLSRDETRLQALADSADRSIRQLADEIGMIAIDDEALSIAIHIEALDIGRARYRSAEDDLPKRKLAVAEQEGMLAAVLRELDQAGHVQPDALLLPASSIGVIRELIEKRSGIDAEITAAGRELKRTSSALERLREDNAMEQEPASGLRPQTQSRIDTVLARLTGASLAARLAVEERARRSAQSALEERMARLAPWVGEIDDLRALTTTDIRQIELWRTEAISIDKRMSEHRSRLRELVTERTLTIARITTFAADGAMDDREAQRLRSDRDEAWRAHLATLDAATARTFEDRMRQDDAATTVRLSRAQELADLRQLTQAAATAAAAIDRQQALLDEASAEHDRLSGRVRAVLPDACETGIDALERLAALESWTIRRADALAASDALRSAQSEVGLVSAELEEQRADLERALSEAGMALDGEVPLNELMRRAAEYLSDMKSREAMRDSQHKALVELTRDLAERERDHDEAKAAADRWQTAWSEALSTTWFADRSGSVAAVRGILSTLAGLPAILKDRHDMAQRVAAMENDQKQFRAEMAAICGEPQIGLGHGDVLAAANALIERYNTAQHDRQVRDEKQAALEKLKSGRQALEEERAVHDARKAELTDYFGADTLAAVGAYLEAAKERDRIERRTAELRDQITQGLRTDSYDVAAQRLSALDIADVERDAVNLASRIDDLTERTRVLYADMTRAQDRLEAVGGDDAVARIEARRQTIFLEIEALAVRYLTLRTGTLAAEQALHIYRDKHRSSMMNRASEAFQAITGGNYTGLATQPDKDKEILIGVSRDGSSKLASAMSTGTQFQLYLALRLAGYEEFAAVRPAVPFVADDIMESFDNPRSEEVFRLLGEMSKVGQVIYLTHHWHLCEMAEAVVPEVTIHRLSQ